MGGGDVADVDDREAEVGDQARQLAVEELRDDRERTVEKSLPMDGPEDRPGLIVTNSMPSPCAAIQSRAARSAIVFDLT